MDINPIQWSNPGVVVMINHKTMKALVFYSNNCLKSYANYLEKMIKDQVHSDLYFDIESDAFYYRSSGYDDSIVFHGHKCRSLVTSGYSLINKKFSIFEPVIEAFKFRGKIRAAVVLRSSKKRIVCGLFDTIIEAQKFFQDFAWNHGTEGPSSIVYANNQLTHQYRIS